MQLLRAHALAPAWLANRMHVPAGVRLLIGPSSLVLFVLRGELWAIGVWTTLSPWRPPVVFDLSCEPVAAQRWVMLHGDEGVRIVPCALIDLALLAVFAWLAIGWGVLELLA